jgi:hypothetical protein
MRLIWISFVQTTPCKYWFQVMVERLVDLALPVRSPSAWHFRPGRNTRSGYLDGFPGPFQTLPP